MHYTTHTVPLRYISLQYSAAVMYLFVIIVCGDIFVGLFVVLERL